MLVKSKMLATDYGNIQFYLCLYLFFIIKIYKYFLLLQYYSFQLFLAKQRSLDSIFTIIMMRPLT